MSNFCPFATYTVGLFSELLWQKLARVILFGKAVLKDHSIQVCEQMFD